MAKSGDASPIWFVLLAVMILVMMVLIYLLPLGN